MIVSKSFRTMLITVAVVIVVAELGARALQPHLPESVTWPSPFAQAKAGNAADLGHTDVVILGSSVANADLDPPAIVAGVPWAATGYNAALPGESPMQWELWARDVVLPDLCPNVLVIAVSPRDTNDNLSDAARDVERYLAADGRLALYGADPLIAQIERISTDLSALVALRERLREPANVYRYLRDGKAPGWPQLNLTPAGRYLGFDDDRTYRPNAERDEALGEGALADYEVGPAMFGALERIVEDARSRGILVILVDLPAMTEELAAIFDDGADDLERYRQAIDLLASRQQVPLLRYDVLNDDPELFSDLYHMRGVGAALVSEMVGTDLGFILPTEPNQPSCPTRDPDRIP
jgi:hypothetical protein